MRYDNILATVGGTPSIRLNRVDGLRADSVWVKVESFNPAGSVKDRPALGMIEDAEARGVLKPGDTIIEPTSGNTGIGLAMTAAVKGYRAVFVMAEDMSEERKLILKAYGADIVLTPADKGTVGAIEEARRLEAEKGWFFVGQHFNPANPASHKSTADEIWADFGEQLDIEGLNPGTELWFWHGRFKEHVHLRYMGKAKHRIQIIDGHFGLGFLPGFAHGTCGSGFAIF